MQPGTQETAVQQLFWIWVILFGKVLQNGNSYGIIIGAKRRGNPAKTHTLCYDGFGALRGFPAVWHCGGKTKEE